MKKIVYSFLLILSVISLSCCDSTFTKKEIKGLSDPKNYKEYNVVFYEIKTIEDASSINNKDTLLYVTFQTLEELNEFMTTPVTEGSDINAYKISFVINQNNNKILTGSSFYNDIKQGDQFKVIVSNFKNAYSTKYFWVASLEYNGKTYLNFDTGMNNIKAFLNEHQSPWFNSGK